MIKTSRNGVMARDDNPIYTLRLRRREIIDLMLSCTIRMDEGSKWTALHDKLEEQLGQEDAKRL